MVEVEATLHTGRTPAGFLWMEEQHHKWRMDERYLGDEVHSMFSYCSFLVKVCSSLFLRFYLSNHVKGDFTTKYKNCVFPKF